MRFAHRVGDPYSAEQRSELAASRTALESIVQHGANDLEAAFSADHRLIGEAAAGRTQSVISAMQLETEMRSDPKLRADVFVQRWHALDRQRRLLMREQETGKAARVADSMIGMAKSLDRDPQVESILRNRRQALGLSSAVKQGVGRELADMMARTRSRGLDIGM